MDAYLNWPAVGLILGLLVILIFQNQFKRLIDRTSKVGKDGASFDRPQEDPKLSAESIAFRDLMKHPVSATVLVREKAIQTEVGQLKITDQQAIELLLRGVAMARIEIDFNRISSNIFGSQLGLLVQISGSSQGIQRLKADAIFADAQKQNPEVHGGQSTDEWLHYLLSTNLVTFQNDRLDITQYGKDFLKHLIDNRLTYSRHG